MSGLKVVFFGTPEFAVATLRAIDESAHEVVGVVTSPDRPSGRGKKIRFSDVKNYALEKKHTLLQPTNLKAKDFLKELSALNADVFVVVAFRMLPESVWSMPPKGTFNLHASLLPNYRGAAPINWAIINGEKETGVTTFFIDHKIDTGAIINSDKLRIEKTETAGTLHDKLMVIGAKLAVETLMDIESNNIELVPQNENSDLHNAPKIFKDDCRIDWGKNIHSISCFIRGLSPYPAAWTKGVFDDKEMTFKIFNIKSIQGKHDQPVGKIVKTETDGLNVYASDGIVKIQELQMEGKKKMKTADFLRGIQGKSLIKFF